MSDDFFPNLDGAANSLAPYDPNAAFSLNPLRRPLVSHPDPAATDAALQRAAELGIQVGLPLGQAPTAPNSGSPGWPHVPGATSAGPGDYGSDPGAECQLGRPRSLPDGLLMGVAAPDPEQGEVSAAQVQAQAAGKGRLPYAKWQAQNPGARRGPSCRALIGINGFVRRAFSRTARCAGDMTRRRFAPTNRIASS